MSQIGSLFQNVLGLGPSARTAERALESQTTSRVQARPPLAPVDRFQSGFIFSNPLTDEISQMAASMKAASTPVSRPTPPQPSKPPVVASKDPEGETKTTFEKEYVEALNQTLKSKGHGGISFWKKGSIAKSYMAAADKLGAQETVRLAGEVMAKNITPSQTRGLTVRDFAALGASSTPTSFYSNSIPVHYSPNVLVAASTSDEILVGDVTHEAAPSPFKTFALSHEAHHIEQHDVAKSLGTHHLLQSLKEYPAAFTEAAGAAQELQFGEEFAADRAGVAQALKEFPAEMVEEHILHGLRTLAPLSDDHDHPEVEARCEAVSRQVKAFKAQAQSGPATQDPFSGLVFKSPIFDDLKKMMA